VKEFPSRMSCRFVSVSRTVCSPYSTVNTTYGDRAFPVFRSISHLLRHFLSSVLAPARHTSSNSVTRSYCCRARGVALSFIDT